MGERSPRGGQPSARTARRKEDRLLTAWCRGNPPPWTPSMRRPPHFSSTPNCPGILSLHPSLPSLGALARRVVVDSQLSPNLTPYHLQPLLQKLQESYQPTGFLPLAHPSRNPLIGIRVCHKSRNLLTLTCSAT